ncbi:TetR/AcrR family transcriptional regulator [Burkholderia sp. 22PA0099]|uniref:TetR/AcrR family transcriptional regulator n=1 Tax=Burkholderia sp. 22PA0099 TaxID=3237372 RepID=UPI0039C36528
MNSAAVRETASDTREGILSVGQTLMASRGFSAVGLNEILAAAGVPKGSFYHYFGSKDAFGEALLNRYFEDYLADLDITLAAPKQTSAQRLMTYWQQWRTNQGSFDCQGKCLAVKLAAEVVDLSETMRAALDRGTSGIVARLTGAIEAGRDDGSLSFDGEPAQVAQSLYELWLGASILVKIVRSMQPFETALSTTRKILGIAG